MHLPMNTQWTDPDLLPEYLISCGNSVETAHKPDLDRYYYIVHNVPSPKFPWLFKQYDMFPTENISVTVYKKI